MSAYKGSANGQLGALWLLFMVKKELSRSFVSLLPRKRRRGGANSIVALAIRLRLVRSQKPRQSRRLLEPQFQWPRSEQLPSECLRIQPPPKQAFGSC